MCIRDRARIVFDAWRAAGLGLEGWREMQPTLHDEFALVVEEAYHETNRWLVTQGVLPEVDLRPFIRRSLTHPNANMGFQGGSGSGALAGGGTSGFAGDGPPSERGFFGGWSGGGHGGRDGVAEETRMMTRSAPLARSREHAEAVLGRLNRLIGRHVPEFCLLYTSRCV